MAFTYRIDKSKIVTITMDMPGRSANIINEEFALGFKKVLEKVRSEKNVIGVIVASAKKTFLAGGDLKIIYRQENQKDCFELIESGKSTQRQLETLGIPIVAVINGAALGGGMEIAQSCHYRIVVNNPKIKLGWPEVTLGILPGGGGVARLSRLIGIEASLPFLIEGKQINPQAALKVGFIDELVDNDESLFLKAKEWIINNPLSRQPWDKKDFHFPGGNVQSPKIAKMLSIATVMLMKKTRGNYPAPEAIISAVAEGSLVDFDTASKIESRYFVKLVTGKVSKNIIKSIWFQLNEIKSGLNRPSFEPKTEVKKLGILGSGLMGHGITFVSALAGIDVVMVDATQQSADGGLKRVEAILDSGIKSGRTTLEKKNIVLSKIIATDNYNLLDGCDMIIEAVFEDRDLKGKVTVLAENIMNSDGVFASNTSTIPITSLAKKSQREKNFIGIHFFSPVHKMKLVEIIKGQKTSPATLAKAFDYVLKIKKIPIVVNDSRGFYTYRVFEKYTAEGMALLSEGNPALGIESAGKKAGLPVGPLAVTDEINIGLVAQIRDQTRKDLIEAEEPILEGPWDDVIDFMTQKAKRFGRAGGAGFYTYPEKGKKFLWPDLPKYFKHSKDALSQQEMIDRMLFAQVLETIRCYEEGVLTSVADANIGSIFGWGFAPFKGGTLQFVNDYGIELFKDKSIKLANKFGKRFTPPNLLMSMVEENKKF